MRLIFISTGRMIPYIKFSFLNNKSQIHAEMVMLGYLIVNKLIFISPASESYQYMGLSKRSCVMCNSTLRLYDYLMNGDNDTLFTKGCHGRIYSDISKGYKEWVIPFYVKNSEYIGQQKYSNCGS